MGGGKYNEQDWKASWLREGRLEMEESCANKQVMMYVTQKRKRERERERTVLEKDDDVAAEGSGT